MPNLFSRGARPLPETLLEDLRELLTWDNNCLLTWGHVGGETDPDGSRWFSVLFSSNGSSFGLRLEFWVPDWMTERGVGAILPAHLSVADLYPGKRAVVDLGMRSRADLEASLPKVARTCARLMNELWGPTASDDVLLMTMEYQPEVRDEPFGGG
jgi:hypothetical protein